MNENDRMECSEELRAVIKRCGQAHLLDHREQLAPPQRALFTRQIAEVNFAQLTTILTAPPQNADWTARAERAQPPPVAFRRSHMPQDEAERAQAAGAQALSAGKVAVVLVAGGQGTRLGFDAPKGLFSIGPLSGRTLFQVLVDRVRGYARKYSVSIPVCVMTSPATHAATVQYFADNGRLGLAEDELLIFCQGTMPVVDSGSGEILLEGMGQLALSPDGHGGMLQALVRSGVLQSLSERGIEHLFYGQIDNPLTLLCDPLTLGLHRLHRSEMTTQVIRKQDPHQRVGNVVSVDDRLHVIEYSDIPASVAAQRTPDGQLRLWAGNIAVHVFDLSFLERVKDQATALPFHWASKKVPFVDRQGNWIVPQQPNATKFERFIFDLLPSAQRALVVEIDPADGFAAVKNDLQSPTENARTAQAAIVAQHVNWLQACGAHVGEGVVVEIHPLFALDPLELAQKIEPGSAFERPTYFRP